MIEPGMAQIEKPVLVQAFVPEPAVERFDIGVLIGFPRLDQPELDAVLVCPSQHRAPGEFLTVVRSNDFRIASKLADSVKHTNQMIATDCMFGVSRNAFRRAVVDNAQDLELPPASDSVEDEIHRPDLVGCFRALQRLTIGDRHLLSLASLDLQLLCRIQPLHALVVHDLAGLTKLQIDHPGAVALVTLSQRDDLLPELDVAIRPRPIAQRARAHFDDPQCFALR